MKNVLSNKKGLANVYACVAEEISKRNYN